MRRTYQAFTLIELLVVIAIIAIFAAILFPGLPERRSAHRMALAGNRHQGGLNGSFCDGHAKWLQPSAIDSSKTLTGCTLIHNYPLLPSVCDAGVPGCTNTSAANICNSFTY